MTGFKLRGDITEIEVIASGRATRVLAKLRKAYGAGFWRKVKGTALVELPDGAVVHAELPWYEAHGIGRREGQAPSGMT